MFPTRKKRRESGAIHLRPQEGTVTLYATGTFRTVKPRDRLSHKTVVNPWDGCGGSFGCLKHKYSFRRA